MNKQQAHPSDAGPSNPGDQFSKAGFIFAAIGSAVGLGNLWKFPYITGKFGGGAFFMLFILCLIIIALPVLIAELAIGRGGRGNASSSFYKLSGSKFWAGSGLIGVVAAFMILSFYSVVAGWTVYYAVKSFSGSLFSNPDYNGQFEAFTGSWSPVFWQFIVLAICLFVILKGVSSGIEKFNKVLIPGLVIVLLFLMVQALRLPGAGAGVEFFLKPDFSKLTGHSVLEAMGLAFFSMSLGMGAMITFGSYVQKEQSLGTASIAVGLGNLSYALIAGLIIFPTTFAFGIEPAQGPGLVFVVLPAAFSAMPFGSLFGGLFFVLLAMAALTSAVSLLEVPTAYVMSRWNLSRKKAAVYTTIVVFALGVPAALSVGGVLSDIHIFGKNIFDIIDYIASNILLPLGGLAGTIFAGYVWKKAGEEAGLQGIWYKIWRFLLCVITPILIVLVFLSSTGLLDWIIV
ncbi:sodium-dependent transporter [Paenibacillus sp. N1-5-1-14]|uniref:sodium-dependent transporter n=1 Tax=Paenibacillus radicibacter TaxID=2972488 RepID=UPI0021595031|nr:sodium-dependent transporter [Paenibacillus radicibacter]MCR8642625.1 sodium-dependent transporter [Paenibacillus radicibacter]